MIKDNQKLLNRLHVVIDALVIIFSYTAAWYLRFKSGIFELDPWFLSLQEYMKALLIIVISDPVLCLSVIYAEAGTGQAL